MDGAKLDKMLSEGSYFVLMDSKTKTYYMKPREVSFYAFSSSAKFKDNYGDTARLVQTEYNDFRSLATDLFNAGFMYGYLDGEKIRLQRSDAFYYNQNCNELAFSQYSLTGDERYLTIIKKSKLFTVCQIKDDVVLFPTVELPDGTEAVMTYTSIGKIPTNIFDKYPGYHIVYMTYKTPCVINGQVIVE